MATTYEAIATVEVGSGGAADIEFTSIPATYTDLCLLSSLHFDSANSFSDISVKINGDTGNNYSSMRLGVQSTTVSTGSATNTYPISLGIPNGDGSGSLIFANTSTYFPNYAGNTYKSISSDSVAEQNATAAYSRLVAGLWSNTAAITSISIYASGFNWKQHSTATLYGIKNS